MNLSYVLRSEFCTLIELMGRGWVKKELLAPTSSPRYSTVKDLLDAVAESSDPLPANYVCDVNRLLTGTEASPFVGNATYGEAAQMLLQSL